MDLIVSEFPQPKNWTGIDHHEGQCLFFLGLRKKEKHRMNLKEYFEWAYLQILFGFFRFFSSFDDDWSGWCKTPERPTGQVWPIGKRASWRGK
ncbi:hypothetical protein D9X91_11040 [Falsibacillus albus]|uniref:Uncharacterized protein n=1 Tax=Falsibacillus albus TaxID=2478915 RepID=A0A3L7JXQ5_9BACI|nr:hypothetical protein D9X91_11040 [Falsibacillus albus]